MMPRTMRASQSQDILDVSVNFKTPSSHARPGPTDSPAKVQVKDSRETPSKSRTPSKAQQPPATPHAERQDEEEELYSISPEQKARTRLLRSQTKAGGPINHSQKGSISRDRQQESNPTVAVPNSVKPSQDVVAHVETQKSTTACPTPQRLQFVTRAVENPVDSPKTAVEKAGTTSATRQTSTTSSNGSNSSKKHITTSQTSAMASTGKGKLKHIKPPLSSATARLRARRANNGDMPKDGATIFNAKVTQNRKMHIVGSQLASAAKDLMHSQCAKPTDGRADGMVASRNSAATRNSPLTVPQSQAADTKAKMKDRMECKDTKKFPRQELGEIVGKGKARATSPVGEKEKKAKQRQSQTSEAVKTELPPGRRSLAKMTKDEDSGDEEWSEKPKRTQRRQPMRVAATANNHAQEQAKRDEVPSDEGEHEIEQDENPRTSTNEKARTGKFATPAVEASQKGQRNPSLCAKIDDELPSPDGNDLDENDDPVQPETFVSQGSIRRRCVIAEDGEDGIEPNVSRKSIDPRAESGKHEDLAPPDEVDAIESLKRHTELKRTKQDAEPATLSKTSAERADEKAGDTQEYPVLLSDNERSSSHESSPEPDLTASNIIAPGLAELRTPGQASRTPASMQCSSLATRFANDRSLVHSRPDYKTTIISFDKSGPRNQGARPHAEPALHSGNNNRSSLSTVKEPLTYANLDDLGKEGPSSAATTVRIHMSAKPAPASNVASSFQDALVAFPGFQDKLSMSIDAVEPVPRLPGGRRQDETRRREEPHLPDNQFDGEEDTSFYLPWTIAQSELELRKATPTASQQAMPPPGKPKESPQSLLPIATPIVPIQASQKVAKKFPQAKRPRTPEPETYRAAKRVKAVDTEQNAAEAAQLSSTGPVRISTSQPADRIPSKKRRVATKDAMDHASRRPQLDQIDLPAKDGSTRAPVEPFPSKHKAAVSMTASISKPKTRRDQAKQHSQPSHAQSLQTVDINGSPVPPDFNPSQSSTVLETFQTLSDEFIEAGDRVEQVASGQGIRDLGFKRRSSVSRFLETDIDADGRKLQSALPEGRASDHAFDRVSIMKMTLQGSKKLTEPSQSRSLSKANVPFANSPTDLDRRLNDDGEISPVSTLLQRFERSRQSTESGAGPEKRKGNINVVFAEDPQWVAEERVRKDISLEPDFLGTFSRADIQSRQSTTITREGEEADLDQTLVDGEEAAHPTQRIFEAPKAMEPEPATAMRMLDPLSDDLLSWCRTLKPRQLNLFDELVKVQLRVCQYIFEQENSIERILKEQHQQGMTQVKEQELERAREYAELADVLRRTRREVKKDVRHKQEVVREKIGSLQSSKRKWKTRQDEREQANRHLDTLLRRVVALQ